VSTQLLSWFDSGYNPSDPKSVASGAAVSALFVTLSLIYFAVMMYGAFTIRGAAGGVEAGGLRPGNPEGQAAGDHGQRLGRERHPHAVV
jgi:hypothetical protein